MTETSRAFVKASGDSLPVMNTQPSDVIQRARPWPVKALAIWLIDACAIVVLALVMLVVNEFKHQPGDTAAKRA